MKIMNSSFKEMKFIDNVSRVIKKEGAKMIRKYMIVGVTLLTFLCNVLPAQAYTTLQTEVAITSSGIINPNTITFDASLITQGSTVVPPNGLLGLTFDTPLTTALVTNSGKAIKIRGGTNVVGSRVIIYTDLSLIHI